MRIVHLIWSLEAAGAESILVDIINEQVKTQNVHLMIVNRLEAEELVDKINSKVNIHRILRKPGSRNIMKLIQCNLQLMRLNPDVIHCHNHDLIQFLPLARKKVNKTFLTIHDMGISPKMFSQFNRLFFISKAVQENVYNRSGLKGTVISNGIRTDLINVKIEYSDTSTQIVQIGRLRHLIKGQDIAIKAVAHLVHQKKIKKISIDFIGTGPSEPYLRKLAEKLDVFSYCNFIGFKPREWIYENLCSYDLLVQPSRYEGFGLTVAEAMAARVPVLVSDQDGPMEIIGNGKYGYSFCSGNCLDMAEKISEIQKNYVSSEIQEKISSGFSRVIELYDIRHTAAAYISEYES